MSAREEKPAWTPGPWEADTTFTVDRASVWEVAERSEYGDYPPPIALCSDDRVDDGSERRPIAECQANARLIATAPDLAVEVNQSAITFEEMAKVLRSVGRSGCADICEAQAQRCRAVLAKASSA